MCNGKRVGRLAASLEADCLHMTDLRFEIWYQTDYMGDLAQQDVDE